MGIKVKHTFMIMVLGILSGCATSVVPTELVLKDPQHRVLEDNVAMDVQSVRIACAKSMLSASPGYRARNIETRVISTGEIITVEVDAVIEMNMEWNREREVTFNCSYKGGHIYQTHWTRGLK